MTSPRRILAALALIAAGCSSPSPAERTATAELAEMAPLKRAYPEVVMGFDVGEPSTLTVSLDLQHFDEMDDDAVAAMEKSAVTRWRAAWSAAHPREHALLRIRFIDFIGRKVAERSVNV